MSNTRTRLIVYTTRLHSAVNDPDTLDITRRTAGEYEKAIVNWRELDGPSRDALRMEGIDRARTCTARRGTVVDAQRVALTNGYPSLGAPWAPSWDLLIPALAMLDLADHHGKKSLTLSGDERAATQAEALRLQDLAWASYVDGWTRDGVTVPGFVEQMQGSWKTHRAAWRWMLGLEKVALACLCRKPRWWPADRPWTHCHRFAVADLLVKCGAASGGELPEPDAKPSPQIGLALG